MGGLGLGGLGLGGLGLELGLLRKQSRTRSRTRMRRRAGRTRVDGDPKRIESKTRGKKGGKGGRKEQG